MMNLPLDQFTKEIEGIGTFVYLEGEWLLPSSLEFPIQDDAIEAKFCSAGEADTFPESLPENIQCLVEQFGECWGDLHGHICDIMDEDEQINPPENKIVTEMVFHFGQKLISEEGDWYVDISIAEVPETFSCHFNGMDLFKIEILD